MPPNSYQSDAREVAKQKYNIELFEIEEISPELLHSWLVPESIKVANLIERNALSASFVGLNGGIINVAANELSNNTPIFQPGKNLISLGSLIRHLADEGDRNGYTQEWLNKLFEDVNIWNTDEEYLSLPTNLNFRMAVS